MLIMSSIFFVALFFSMQVEAANRVIVNGEIMFKYTEAAEILIATQEYFKKQDFEKWYKKNNKYIIYQNLMDYLVTQRKIGVIEFANELSNVVIDRELIIADEIKDILGKVNVELLKKFYIRMNSLIGDYAIYSYINRDKMQEQGEKRKKIEEITDFLFNNFDKIKNLVS